MLMIMTVWIFCGALAVVLATSKGHKDLLMLLSCLALGPIGVVLATKKKKLTMPCPYCDEPVVVEKNACSLCGLTLEKAERIGETIVSKQCLICRGNDVHDAYIEDGSWGKWCPNCKMSIKRMRER